MSAYMAVNSAKVRYLLSFAIKFMLMCLWSIALIALLILWFLLCAISLSILICHALTLGAQEHKLGAMFGSSADGSESAGSVISSDGAQAEVQLVQGTCMLVLSAVSCCIAFLT